MCVPAQQLRLWLPGSAHAGVIEPRTAQSSSKE